MTIIWSLSLLNHQIEFKLNTLNWLELLEKETVQLVLRSAAMITPYFNKNKLSIYLFYKTRKDCNRQKLSQEILIFC